MILSIAMSFKVKIGVGIGIFRREGLSALINNFLFRFVYFLLEILSIGSLLMIFVSKFQFQSRKGSAC